MTMTIDKKLDLVSSIDAEIYMPTPFHNDASCVFWFFTKPLESSSLKVKTTL
jgi:hypothetical protein